MTYFLNHFFEPDFDHTDLAPREREDGSVDHQDLSYVQNVVKSQVLAQWEEVNPAEEANLERRFIASKPRDVVGDNCYENPDNPAQILAGENGYVFYLNGLITVKTLLNVRRDVDYHTGNIPFVGSLVVHGSVRTGFMVRANTVRIKDVVEGATVNAMDSVVCEVGVKGAGRALLEAGRTIKAPFCENGTLKARDNVVIDGACMHSQIFAGHKFASKGRVTGGSICCYEYAYIGDQLGGGIGAQTQVMVGYDPMLLYVDQRLNNQILQIKESIKDEQIHLGKDDELDLELNENIAALQGRLGRLYERKTRIWDKISTTEILDSSRIMVKGRVHPGVEISIGPAWLKVDDYMEDVYFYLEDLEIKIGSPALKK